MRHFERRGLPGLIETAEVVLDAVSDGMALVLRTPPQRRASFETVRRLSRLLFQKLDVQRMRSTGANEHLVRGLFGYGQEQPSQRLQERPTEYARPRLADLILMHCQEASNQADDSSPQFILIPSPVYVAIEALTIPEDIHTRAYAILAYRMILSRRFDVWPAISFSPVNQAMSPSVSLSESMIVDEIRSIRTFLEHRDNRSATTSNLKQFVSHFIAGKGIFYLRLRARDVNRFLRSKVFSLSKKGKLGAHSVPEFRLSKRYRELPEAASFINEMLGVPIPIRGADTIFMNGLKPSVDRNLVVEVSGESGTGKTSFCLALAAAFAPLDTHTLYLSFEEDEDDLKVKLKTYSQPRLRRLSFYQRTFGWFSALRLPDLDLAQFENTILDSLKQKLTGVRGARDRAISNQQMMPPLPIMIVIDSVSSITVQAPQEGQERAPRASSGPATVAEDPTELRQRLIRFVERCRDLGALVILVASKRTDETTDLDYLVDTVITLSVKDSHDHEMKPLRLFTLSKSRHQVARNGTHVFHLSGESGFRFAPQLPSQIDAQHAREHMLWDPNTEVHVLNVYRQSARKYAYRDVLPLPVRSHILIYGRGSTGKAGLALKCALSPRFTSGGFDRTRLPHVLIVSFLYPERYYEELRKRITSSIVREQRALESKGFDKRAAAWFVASLPKLGFVQLAPGFLSGEDLYSKIVRKLESAHLEGRPYSDVIIDGLHNLALQFPGARDTDVLWPIVYGTLSRADVTTITTFTSLGLADESSSILAASPEEALFRLRTHLPLMHALVQASDFVLEVKRDLAKAYNIAHVRSAINREPPIEPLLWRRDDLELFEADAVAARTVTKSHTETTSRR